MFGKTVQNLQEARRKEEGQEAEGEEKRFNQTMKISFKTSMIDAQKSL